MAKPICYFFALIPLVLGLSAQACFAESASAPALDIIVTGRGLEPAPGERVLDVITLDRDRISSSASDRLESVLADVAGLQQFRRSDSRSANVTSQGITLRGIGGNASSRALLILDGVPQADPFGGWVVFPAYATDRLGLVRVTRGGGSGYFGPGALAGTVELESATPAQQEGAAQGRIAFGSRNALDVQGSASMHRGEGFATLYGAYARGDGFIPTVAESRGSIDQPAPYEQASGTVRAVIGVSAQTELQANTSAFIDTRNRGTRFTDNQSKGADASVRLVSKGRWSWSALVYLQTRASASSAASVDGARTTATQTLSQYNTPATGIGGRIEIAPPVGKRFALRLGADARILSGQTEETFAYLQGHPTRGREAGGQSANYGAFLDGSLSSGRLTVAFGGRIDHWDLSEGFRDEHPLMGAGPQTRQQFPHRSGDEVTGRIGLAWSVIPPLMFRAAAYRGWRLPTLNELYRPFRIGTDVTAANAALDPERLTGYEFGMTLSPAAGVQLRATWFDNRLKNAIANVTVATGPGAFPDIGYLAAGASYRVRQNLGELDVRGIELDGEARFEEGFARASWSHMVSRIKGSGSAVLLDGLTPAQTPRDLLSATLGWRRGRTVVSTTLRHSGRQFDDDLNRRALAQATTVDGFVAFPLASWLTAEARAENITDTRIETAISGANIVERATPRTFWIGLSFSR